MATSQDHVVSLPVRTDSSTTGGSYFVSNYPPFGAWTEQAAAHVVDVLNRPARPNTTLGQYVHLPFCRKRCHFCYFKVYTDRNAAAIARYLDAVIAEAERYTQSPAIAGRKPRFIYFGGGTPSYLSVTQLQRLFGGLQGALPWDAAEEIAFECEPGTLNETKLHALRDLGITRLSLGVENFDPHILEVNNRAHDARAVDRAYDGARAADFPQINIDLIAGMMDETDANWQMNIDRTLAMSPDSVTIYQMEIPFNTTIYRQMKQDGKISAPVADWPTKRRWVAEAFEQLEAAGYHIASAYTAVKDAKRTQFLYRDDLWRGADMIALGVSSFGHISGVHYQNRKDIDDYVGLVEAGDWPLRRAMVTSPTQSLIRELVLQFKLGHVDIAYFRSKFGVSILETFREPIGQLQRNGDLRVDSGQLVLTRDALLRVDSLLPAFFEAEYR